MKDKNFAINIALEKIVAINKEYKELFKDIESFAIENIKNKGFLLGTLDVISIVAAKHNYFNNLKIIGENINAVGFSSTEEFVNANYTINGLFDVRAPILNEEILRLKSRNIDVSSLAAIISWKYTKSVYSINNYLADELIKSEAPTYIPVEYFEKIPEWSIFITGFEYFINTKNEFFGEQLLGFWLTTSLDFNSKRVIMFSFLFSNGSISSFPLRMDVENIMESYYEITSQSDFNTNISLISIYKELLNVAIPLSLFIIKQHVDNYEYIEKKSNAFFKKTKGLDRLFEAKKIKKTIVGEEIGKTIQLFKEKLTLYSNQGKVRPHVRRAHWHGYWKGKSTEKEFILKWIPATLVNADCYD